MNTKELKIIANSYVNGIIQYGILCWAKNNHKLIEKVEKLRIKIIKAIHDNDETKDLNRDQILNLMNWNSIEDARTIAENVRIHKIIATKKPVMKYNDYTDNRTSEQIKYKHINTRLCSQDSYNMIPLNIRNKNIKNFKKSYKLYRIGLKYKPKIIKSNTNNTYMLVWPGS